MSKPSLLPDRAVIRITGQDRHKFLQGVITQDMGKLSPETPIFSALLTPQGKILADFIIVDTREALFVDCNKENSTALMKRLSLYKLRAKVSIDLDEELCVLADKSRPTIEGVASYPDPRHEKLGWRVVAPSGEHVSNADYNSTRIELAVAEFGQDFGADEMFLLDVNYDALNAVSYKKGCFIGQEVSSRMKRKGEPRRRTLIAEFDEPAPQKRAEIVAGGSKLGELMSCSGNLALASVRIDRWEKAISERMPLECANKSLQLRVPEYLEQG
ncbi:hypothetical protein PUV54_00975 [Hyphococcus flavus]|uniref:CAF17 C-terminal domain-containing protein n=1 Tax=Hyphococcus flavus TaxID=1866326 RepID=A0AAE9ZFG1_9PROT|nr:hypothetical protein [Hyphococcus flavus]WDI31757.1 hypothetical protein PUV54_00975 [Hyphococcus flavus]